MSKMSELAQTLDSLTEAGNRMTEWGEELLQEVRDLRKLFSTTQEEEKKLSFIDLRKAFSAKAHAGYSDQIRALIARYGADKLSAVREEDYPAILADLEALE